MYHLKQMKDKLVEAIEKQVNGNLDYANTEELGEAVDMVKDLSEAIYYCSITEAMNEKEKMTQGNHYPVTHYYGEPMYKNYSNEYDVMRNDYPILYYGNESSSKYYNDTSTRYMPYGEPRSMLPQGGDRTSHFKRKYMDGKSYNDKNAQMKELEQYTQELATDITEMIKDASPEEKQLLQQKISLLATKIK